VATQKDSLFAYALTKGANTGAEFWTILGGKVLDRRRGTAALTSWDARSAGLAGEYTTDDTIVLHFGSYTRKDGGHVTIGDAAVPFNPEGQSFRAFFDQPDVKKAFASFASENQGKPRLLVFRDGSFRQGIAEHGGNGSLFESAGRLRVDPQRSSQRRSRPSGEGTRSGWRMTWRLARRMPRTCRSSAPALS
jgi:hypothetical protein